MYYDLHWCVLFFLHCGWFVDGTPTKLLFMSIFLFRTFFKINFDDGHYWPQRVKVTCDFLLGLLTFFNHVHDFFVCSLTKCHHSVIFFGQTIGLNYVFLFIFETWWVLILNPAHPSDRNGGKLFENIDNYSKLLCIWAKLR